MAAADLPPRVPDDRLLQQPPDLGRVHVVKRFRNVKRQRCQRRPAGGPPRRRKLPQPPVCVCERRHRPGKNAAVRGRRCAVSGSGSGRPAGLAHCTRRRVHAWLVRVRTGCAQILVTFTRRTRPLSRCCKTGIAVRGHVQRRSLRSRRKRRNLVCMAIRLRAGRTSCSARPCSAV